MDPARTVRPPAVAIGTDEDARAIVATHTEDDDGYCAPCRDSGIRVHVPCFALIEAARHLAALNTRTGTPSALPASPGGAPDPVIPPGGVPGSAAAQGGVRAATGVPPC